MRSFSGMRITLWFLLLTALLPLAQAERINHEGRILPDPPVVTTPLLFNTPEADAVLAGLQILPRDNPWNERVDQLPLASNSLTMINRIIADLATNRRTLRPFYEMNYVLVPDTQPTKPIEFLDYPDESDLDGGSNDVGLYPIPSNLPVEQWPLGTGSLTLQQWQQDINDDGGDRHSIIVKPSTGAVWETWQTKLVGTAWQSSNGAKFNLNSNALRPPGWTSGDAAGLSLFAGLARYDECARGMVEHAIRCVVAKSRHAYVYPATHYASSQTSTDYPRMGERLRLKASFVIPDTWSIYEKAVAKALKKYGCIVADNGGFFSISVAPDTRFPGNAFDHLSTINVSSFEVVQGTGPSGGPRSPGTPSVAAGSDQFVNWPATITLNAGVTDPDAPQTPVTRQWVKYDGPGTVTFGNATQAQTTATFSLPGRYRLMFSADDGVHTPAYDAVVVEAKLTPAVLRSGNDAVIQFPSVSGRLYRVERSSNLSTWTTLQDNIPGTGNVVQMTHAGALGLGVQFYRVVVLP
jgi:hypothetical protein